MGHWEDHEEPARRAMLQIVTMANRNAETAIENRVDAINMALERGATWTELGAAMGMSRQAAHKRFNGRAKPSSSGRKH